MLKMKIWSKPLAFSKAYSTLRLFQSGPLGGGTGEARPHAYGARFQLEWDVSPLFPLINAIVPDARLYETPVYIKFLLNAHLCAFYPQEGAFSPVQDYAGAVAFLDDLIAFIKDIHARRAEITPNYKKFKPTSALDIFQLLPGTNCRGCGHATCLAFAAAVSRQKSSPSDCPHLGRPVEEKALFPVFDAQGGLIRTIALEIDSSALRERIHQKETQIQTLRSRLESFEQERARHVQDTNQRLPDPLSRREIQVLQMLAGGFTNKEISSRLNISEHTVKSHVVHIFNKIGVNDRTQASVWAVSHGLLE
jgi:DNA-binding CsgD family transcriptional regulator/ArsR family metal-binding transcriptional regulator